MPEFTDNFNRADVTPLDNGWTGFNNRYGVFSNKVGPNTTGTHAARAPVEPTSNTIYAEVDYTDLVSGTFTGVAVCMPATMGTSASNTGACYVLWATGSPPSSVSIRYKPVNGNVTSMTGGTGTASVANSWVAGDRMRLEADLDPSTGATTELRGYVNGVLKLQYVPAAAQTVTGQRGVGLYTGTANTAQRFDNFAGGDKTAPPTQTGFYSTANYAGPATLSEGTTDKPQSKLFFTDGSWFGVFPATTSPYLHIWRYDTAAHAWTSTGTTIASTTTAHADVLWDEASQTLFIATADTGGASLLYKYTYNASTNAFTNVINGLQLFASGETVTIALDSLGRLWAATEIGTEMVFIHSTTNHSTWTTPTAIPGQAANDADDICAVVKFGSNKIAVIWPNQINDNIYFAIHNDADNDSTWTIETAWAAVPSGADDHINAKVAEDGTVFAVTKHFDERVSLLWRTPAGVWSNTEVTAASFSGTRPQVVLDETYKRVIVLVTQLGGGHVLMRNAPMDAPASLETGVNVIDKVITGKNFDDVTTSKQPWTDVTDGLAIATRTGTTNEVYTVEAVANTVSGFGSITAITGTTSTGRKDGKGTGAVSATATLTSTGTSASQKSGTGTISATATLPSTGTKAARGAPTIASLGTLTSTGRKGGLGTGAVSAVATLTSAGGSGSAVNKSGTGLITAVASLTSTGSRGSSGSTGVIGATATLLVAGRKAVGGTASITAATLVAVLGGKVQWYFSPPTTEVTTPHQDRFWRRLKNPRSVSVLKQPSGAYVQVYEPSGEQIDGASAAYIGGHRYPVDETEAQSLREAGYDAYLTAGT